MKVRVLVFSLLATLAACGAADSTGPSGPDVTGVWNMRTVNGIALPAAMNPNGTPIIVSNDVLTVDSDGTYADNTVYQSYSGGIYRGATQLETGRWSLSKGTMTFTASDGTTYTGAVSGATLTEFAGGYTQVYTR